MTTLKASVWQTIFSNDYGVLNVIFRIHQDAISSAFDAAWQYANTFEPYRQFYQENESLDLEAIRQGEHGMVGLFYCKNP